MPNCLPKSYLNQLGKDFNDNNRKVRWIEELLFTVYLGRNRCHVLTGCCPNPNLLKISNMVKNCIQQNQQVKFSLYHDIVAKYHKMAFGQQPVD